MRASSFLKLGKYKEAINDCDQIIKENPENFNAYYIRGHAYDLSNNLDKGIENFNQVLRLNPNHINAAYALGSCENKKGNFVQAIENYKRALEKDSSIN